MADNKSIKTYLIAIWVIHFQGLYINTQEKGQKRVNLEFSGQSEVNIVEKQFFIETNFMRVTCNLIYVQVTNRNKW